MKKRLVVFHPAIAPYRVDFFNSISENFDTTFYFEFGDALEQSFAQEELKKRLRFVPQYLEPGLWGIKNLRLQVLSILRNKKPDVVFCSEFNILGLLILIYKFLFNRKLKIFTVCDDSLSMATGSSGLKRIFRNTLINQYDGIVVANGNVLKWYENQFKTRDKFIYFPIIQEDEGFRKLLSQALPLSRKLAIEFGLVDKKILLFVGRLTPVKNLSFLIEAFSSVAKLFPELVLVFVGEGDEKSLLIERATLLGVEDKVIFAGKKQGLDLMAWYNIGQVFVLPSFFEPFGAVVNEALLSGCYTLCSAAAGASCLIKHPDNGDLFDPYSISDLEEKLQEAISKKQSLNAIDVKDNLMVHSYTHYQYVFLNRTFDIVEIKNILGQSQN